MARKFELMIVMLSYSAFLLILFQVAADNHSDLNVYGEEVVSDDSQWSNGDELTLDRDTTTPRRRELQGVVSVVKGLFKVYRIWNKSRQAYEVVNWSISQVHDYIDGQCPAEFYCCKNNLFLDCKSCCHGIRPDIAPSSAPAPSPLPSP